jgi:hypothetical protein
VTTKAEAGPSQRIISRTKEYFHYPNGPGDLILDHDPSIYGTEFTLGELIELLTKLIPELQDCAYAVQSINSTGVSMKGERASGSMNCLVKDKEKMLGSYNYPATDWQHIRTNQPL